MSKLKQKRRRGVILTPEGLEKLEQARLESEYQENFGDRYTYEKISELTNLDINTIKKILAGKERVDKRSLERFFIAFNLRLTENHYTKTNPNKRQDWGEAISVADFFGRSSELKTLETWLLKDRCRLVSLLGMGGIGKTELALQYSQKYQTRYYQGGVCWIRARESNPGLLIVASFQALRPAYQVPKEDTLESQVLFCWLNWPPSGGLIFSGTRKKDFIIKKYL